MITQQQGGNQGYQAKGSEGFKSSCVFVSERIVLMAGNDYEKGHKGIKAWGTTIKALDSYLYPMFFNDKKFMEKRKLAYSKIKECNPEDADALFNVYNRIYKLLSVRMAMMGVYPAIPFSFRGKNLRK